MFNEFSRYEDAFQQWVRGGYPDVKAETLVYIQHLSDPQDDAKPLMGTLWEHQWEAFLRIAYAYEVEREVLTQPNGLLLNIVTGGGKTAIIAALIVWLRMAHNVQKFVLLCPNLIVRDRLEDDFRDGKIFTDRSLIPTDSALTKDDFALTVLGSGHSGGWASMLGANVILGNIHQFYESNAAGKTNLASLMNGPRFAVFNDEAHNSPAQEWDAALEKIRPITTLRVDTTATPDRADGNAPDSKMIYEYLIQDALADRLVKTPVVYQPNIETVELTYTDAQTGETRGVEEIDWADIDRRGINATQWVTDDKPMRQQMAIALNRLGEQERRAKGRYQPVLFIVAVCKMDAERASRTMNTYFKVRTLLVTEDSSEEDRRKATELGRAQRGGAPYRAVVSVMMLREGWDVPEVGVVLLLRKFGSKVYGQQVIGRGLRRVRTRGVEEDEPQICAIVDHPKLEHKWLWDLFGSRIRTNVGLEDTFPEDEDVPDPPPRQELVRPENIVEIPEPSGEDSGEFEITVTARQAEPRKNWGEILEGLSYPMQTVTITDQSLKGIDRRELTGDGWLIMESSAEYRVKGDQEVREDVEIDENSNLADGIKDELLAMAERLLDHAGHTAQFKGKVYTILLEHTKTKFLNGMSLGLAEPHHLDTAWRMLSKMEEQITGIPGLIEGMVKYGD